MMGTRGICLCGLLWLGVPGCSSEAASAGAAAVPIIPAPAAVRLQDGAFTVTADTPVRFEPAGAADAARYFTELLARTRELPLTAAPGRGRDAGITFTLQDGAAGTVDESYRLTVSGSGIAVSSSTPAGLLYGAVSLWQLLTAEPAGGGRVEVAAVAIEDRPRFPWRGLMLDSARHYQPPAFIKRFIDLMALHKLNVLHWHLTDDQGWRLEIERYPRLTETGAWRVPAGPAAAADVDPATGEPRRYGGFYSRDEVRKIVAYAAARHVTIVPEIEMPGHASAAMAAYPELGVSGHDVDAVPADWGVYRNVFNVEESTFAFLENVLREVMDLFPGTYIHIGGDEAVKDQWRKSQRVQARMRALGIEDEEALQSWFVGRIGDFLAEHGRRLIGWDEILEGGLPAGATVMSWRGVDGAVAAAAAGHDAVLSPAPTLYFDRRPLDTAYPPGRGTVIGVEDVYRFQPVPDALSEAERRHVLGVQANVWTEHIRTVDRVEYMTFPRAAALAEVAWSPERRLDWRSFTERLPAQLARYRALGVQFAQAGAEPPRREARRRTSHQLTLCSDTLVLSLEDDAPIDGARAVFLVDIMNPCWIYDDAELTDATRLSAAVGQVPFNFRIGDDVKRIPLPEPRTPAGELQVRLDDCDGEVIATLPLAPATGRFGVTSLPAVPLAAPPGEHDLCLTFTRDSVDPMWVIDAVALSGGQ